MGITIEIPGLKQAIPEIPDGSLILIEGQLDPIKTFFVLYLGCNAHKAGRKVVFVTSKHESEVEQQLCHYNLGKNGFEIIHERSARHWFDLIEENSILIIDSFSYLMLDKSLYEFRDNLEDLRKKCKQNNAIVLMTTVDGMLEDKQEVTVGYLVDGIFRFLTKETSVGISRFIRIPKWMGRVAYDTDIHYSFDGKSMKVDMRSRVR